MGDLPREVTGVSMKIDNHYKILIALNKCAVHLRLSQ